MLLVRVLLLLPPPLRFVTARHQERNECWLHDTTSGMVNLGHSASSSMPIMLYHRPGCRRRDVSPTSPATTVALA